MKTYNFTQHIASNDQLEAGVVDLSPELREKVINLLNFNEIPTAMEVQARAKALSALMGELDPDLTGEVQFMLGGAPYLMAAMGEYAPLYPMVFAYSERVSEESTLPDGSVRKVNVFKHKGFVPFVATT